jgi:glycosyltransferase involved in cell wall biosynthesis
VVSGRVVFAVPGDLAAPTGGYAYDRRVIAGLRELGWQVDVLGLGDGFPHPSTETYAVASAKLLGLPEPHPVVIDGLAFGIMDDIAQSVARSRPLLALVHHPLALESGLSPRDAEALRASERKALAAAHAVIVTSPATARLLSEQFKVERPRITVAIPGNDPTPLAHGSRDGVVRLLAVGSIVPRKGYDVLMQALAPLTDLSWHLTIAGARDRDGTTAQQLDAAIARLGLADRVTVAGSVSDAALSALYQGADLFVLASRFEGYGMAYTEAIAHGLPVVGTNAGAIAETVPKGAGILVPPDDVFALTEALRPLIADAAQRDVLAARARAAVRRLPTWRDTAQKFAQAIEAAR